MRWTWHISSTGRGTERGEWRNEMIHRWTLQRRIASTKWSCVWRRSATMCMIACTVIASDLACGAGESCVYCVKNGVFVSHSLWMHGILPIVPMQRLVQKKIAIAWSMPSRWLLEGNASLLPIDVFWAFYRLHRLLHFKICIVEIEFGSLQGSLREWHFSR